MLIDWFTVGAQALNFLVLVWLMKRFLYKPILNAIDKREKLIAAELADASATITRTLFVGLAMIESTAIYCFVVSMILIFANPFWNHVISQAAGK